MSHTSRFLPEAERELLGAISWYEERVKGLGAALVRAVEDCMVHIERFPHAYAEVHSGVRRAPLRRFPYCLFYKLIGEEIVVLACFHASRDPEIWQRRV